MKKDKKVILINGKNDDLYEQAIFVVRDNENAADSQINYIYEAEKILNNYVMDSGRAELINIQNNLICNNSEPENNKKTTTDKSDFETTVNYIMLMFCFIIVLALLRFLI